MDTAFSIHFAPLLPTVWLWTIALAGLLVLAISLLKHRRGLIWRIITFSFFMLALLNPSLLEEEREPISNIAAIVVDDSQSQKMGQRSQRTEEALADLQKQLEAEENIELRIVHAPADNELSKETRLFEALDRLVG